MKKKLLNTALIILCIFSLAFISRTDNVHIQTEVLQRDSVFMKLAASSNLMEIVLGNMAQQRTTNPSVKAYAVRMVTEHKKAHEEIKALAKSKNIALPKVMLRQHSRHENFLRDLTGMQFDIMYSRLMVEEHQEDLNEFENASKKANDADIRTWAESMLPQLQQQLNSALVLREEVRDKYRNMNVNAKYKEHVEKLRSATGRAFDKQYMSMMVMDHNEDVNKFQVASNNAQDTAVRGFATRTLPILRMHKDSATAINKNLK